MAQRQGPGQERRPRAKTPGERAEEAADVQRRLKREAAERREAAAGKPRASGSAQVRAGGRRRTP
jgi:hypothetical protein